MLSQRAHVPEARAVCQAKHHATLSTRLARTKQHGAHHVHLKSLWAPAPSQSQGRGAHVVMRATLDDPVMADLVAKLEEMRPTPPAERDNLVKAINMIDEKNSKDPSKVEYNGRMVPYRLLYSHWITEWVEKLDPKAPDELLILARGRNVEGWRANELKRDAYSPNGAGARQWEGDKKRAQAARLVDIMKEAGYGEMSIKLVEEVMLDRDVPDPRDIRRHDLVAPLGTINYRKLEEACMLQTLRDADAMVFVEKTFPKMFSQLSAEEVLAVAQRELSQISNKCAATIISMNWTQVQRKLLGKALPAPRRFGTILKELEGASAASTHPGDWRYRDFDYD